MLPTPFYLKTITVFYVYSRKGGFPDLTNWNVVTLLSSVQRTVYL